MKSRLPEGRAWNNPFHKRKLFPWSFLCFSDSQVLQGWLSREPANGLLCCSDRQSSAATGVCLLNSRGPRDAREGSGTGAVKSDPGHPTLPGTFSPLTSQAGPNSGSCSSLPLPHSPFPPHLPLILNQVGSVLHMAEPNGQDARFAAKRVYWQGSHTGKQAEKPQIRLSSGCLWDEA